MGLSANQLVHVPGAGDFQLDAIEGPPEPSTSGHPGNDGFANGSANGHAVGEWATSSAGD